MAPRYPHIAFTLCSGITPPPFLFHLRCPTSVGSGALDPPSDAEKEVHVSGTTNTTTGEIDISYTMSTLKRPRQEEISTLTTALTSSETSAPSVNQPISPHEQLSVPSNEMRPGGDKCKQLPIMFLTCEVES